MKHATHFTRPSSSLGVLDDAVLVAGDDVEHVLHRRPQALEDLRHVELVRQRQPGLFQDEDV
jgi:hypothetical protein